MISFLFGVGGQELRGSVLVFRLVYRRLVGGDLPVSHDKELVAEETDDEGQQRAGELAAVARDYLRRASVLVVCGGTVDEAMKNDIAVAQRLGITATTLEGILTVKGQGRR